MSAVDAASSRSSPAPRACSDCDVTASVTSDLHKYQVACNCKQYSREEVTAPVSETPPALPPRPQHVLTTKRRNNSTLPASGEVSRRRKYAWWCVGCGALSAALGGLLAAAHILLRAYTASPHHLETVPAAVPAAMLVLTGVCIMSLARRRNRYSYMIKVVGACCLVCALTCVLVTITTTVIHMNKLQNLKFCEYTKLTRTCTCFSTPDSQHTAQEDEGVRCVFEGVSDCAVVHGALYWCLRGVFALSVTAVLVCIFSSMLAYQLLSHERKKMYWEQLELRCRSLYRPPSAPAAAAAPRQQQTNCSCCAQCHINEPAWDISLQHRFWAPGRMGNLYSPNPGTTRKTSAWSWFPWPRNTAQNSRCRMGGVPQSGDSAYGFCNSDNPQNQQQQPTNQSTAYEDASYPNQGFGQNAFRSQNFQQGGQNLPQGINFGQSASNFAQNQGGFAQEPGFGESSSGTFNAQTGVWGPPPPYSPQARNGSRHHLHQDPASATFLHHHHIDIHRNSMPVHHDPNLGSNMAIQSHTCRNSSYIGHLMHPNIPEMAHVDPEMARVVNPEIIRLNPEIVRINPEMARLNPEMARLNPEMARLNPEMARLNPEMARLNPEMTRLNPALYPADVNEMARLQEMSRLGNESGRFNTLRGHLIQYPECQRQLNMSMGNIHRDCRLQDDNMAIECLHQKNGSKVSDHSSSDSCKKQGKENLAFQNDKHSPIRSSMQDCQRGRGNQNAESEVYFADVSSCCNVSLKAECCINANMSALVGTIENHPESTSESDTGSFTLTRQQRPQPQMVGSRRRPRTVQDPDKHLKNHGKLRAEMSRMNDTTDNSPVRVNERIEAAERINEMSPKIRQMRQVNKPSHPRQSSSDSNVSKTPEFYVPPPPNCSPLSPNTEESMMSDEDDRSIEYLKKNNKPESSKCLAPDCQYEAPREQKGAEELKTNHAHCYSDTNTMDSGWQSGSEKHITD